MGTELQFNIRFELRNGYIFSEIREDINSNNYERIFQKIIEEGKRNSQNKILIDVSKVKLNINILSRFEVGQLMAERARLVFKIAAIISKEEMKEKFAETVARNRGLNFYVFDNEEKAIKWLLE